MSKITVSDFLDRATRQLKKAGIGTARLDCLVLLEDELGQDRSWILAHNDDCLSVNTMHKLNTKVLRRSAHEPLAYIRHKTEFYGRTFYIDRRVLEPRPESETMIDLLKALPSIDRRDPAEQLVVDIGTGSGVLAITAKLELPHLVIKAVDIDLGCLHVASRNAHTLRANITLHKGNLLNSAAAAGDAIYALLCNLPYVPDSFQINPAATWEPRLAIFGGKDGLDLYRRLFMECQSSCLPPRFILTETLPIQHTSLTGIAQQHGYSLRRTDDFIQLFTRTTDSLRRSAQPPMLP